MSAIDFRVFMDTMSFRNRYSGADARGPTVTETHMTRQRDNTDTGAQRNNADLALPLVRYLPFLTVIVMNVISIESTQLVSGRLE